MPRRARREADEVGSNSQEEACESGKLDGRGCRVSGICRVAGVANECGEVGGERRPATAARDVFERHTDLQVQSPGALAPNLVASGSGNRSESPLHAATKCAA